MLSVLTQAVRSIPSSLLQVTPSGLNLPISINQTYQPPGGSIFEPDTLFALQFAVQRIVAIPVNSANPNAGGLVIGVDVSEPVSTSGDPSQLVDLNTSIGPAGYVVDEEASGATFTGGGGVSHNSDFAVVINGNWLSSIVNNVISPQLVDKFPEPLADSRLSFGENALNVSFGTFSPSLNSPWSSTHTDSGRCERSYSYGQSCLLHRRHRTERQLVISCPSRAVSKLERSLPLTSPPFK